MAASGYQCRFTEEVPKELLCVECKKPSREPTLVDCCGEYYCKACISPFLNDNKPCPSCHTAEFNTMLNKEYRRRVLALQARCDKEGRGCQWQGQLEQLHTHLADSCQYVDAQCPNKCTIKVQKQNIDSHLKDDCPKREHRCPYCNYTAAFEVVEKMHWPLCTYYPVPCPNRCGVTGERSVMEDHTNTCNLEEIECDLNFAGCKNRFLRQDQDAHMETTLQKHVALMASATATMRQELDARQDQHAEPDHDDSKEALEETFKQELQKRDEQIQRGQQEVLALQGQIEQLSNKVTLLNMAIGFPPYDFTMTDFTTLKSKNAFWDTPHWYTHLRGFKVCIRVHPNGQHEVRGKYVSVRLTSQIGEFDSFLSWPAKATITLQLLNQHRDQDHVTVAGSFTWQLPTAWDILVDDFSKTFIAHANLGRNEAMKTEYLKNDCLKFRVLSIEVN